MHTQHIMTLRKTFQLLQHLIHTFDAAVVYILFSYSWMLANPVKFPFQREMESNDIRIV